jgi:hypothetical protein
VQDPYSQFHYKAVSPKGTVLALTIHANEEAGDLAFWSAAVEHQKVTIDNMRLVSRDTIRGEGEREGVLFAFQQGGGLDKLVYWIGLFVTPQKIAVFEAAGPEAEMASDKERLRKSIESWRG